MTLALAVLVASAAVIGALVAAGYQARRWRALERWIGRLDAGEDPPEHGGGRVERSIRRLVAEPRQRIAELEQERDERERILAHLDAGVALLDEDDRVVRANHALMELLGRSFPVAPGKTLVEISRTPDLHDLIRRARTEGRTLEAALRLWSPERTLRVTATPLGDSPGAGMLLVFHDQTDAERLQRMRQDFVANVSHELRTPLTSLRGYAETLLEGGLDDVEHRERFVRIIRDQTIRLQALAEDLLALAELERADPVPVGEPFDLRDLAHGVLASYRDEAGKRGLELTLEAGEEVPVVAERPRMEQVLANLVDNALKYTERGRVVLRVGARDGIAWGEVEDTGGGIPDEHLPRIFERFYRVDVARSRSRGGTGLGLSIVRNIVDRQGGRVSVRSRPGHGSVFRFEIPSRSNERVG